tara:strand:+ start:256 stop:378 length:123 start_codon:yes stop_codon:yes gene_type:complete
MQIRLPIIAIKVEAEDVAAVAEDVDVVVAAKGLNFVSMKK